MVPFGKVYLMKPTRHADMLTRILYIWGKTNSTVRYVQGYNKYNSAWTKYLRHCTTCNSSHLIIWAGIGKVKSSSCFRHWCLLLLICISRKWMTASVASWDVWRLSTGILGLWMGRCGKKWRDKAYILSTIASDG